MAADSKMSALCDQLRFYFSDANLRKDRFLLRLTGPRGTGEVCVRELGSFNRVKALVGDDLEAVRAALRLVPGIEVSDDGESVWRTRELSALDDSDERTVYLEPLQTGTSRDMVQSALSSFGEVTYVSLPRLPSGDLKGFAFVEFALPDAAVAASAANAVDEPTCSALAGVGTPLRVMHKLAWLAMKEEYKRALEQGRREAEAQASSLAAAAEAEAAVAAAAAVESAQRRVVKVTGLPKGGTAVKAIRRSMNETFGRVAPVEFVDYGISNSGDVTVGFVRMATPVGAAEAVRILSAEGHCFHGHAVRYELLRGEALSAYTEMIIALRHSTAKARKVKRDKWWERKHGPGKKAPKEDAAEADANGGEEQSEEQSEELQKGEGRGAKRGRDGDDDSELGGDGGAKRGRDE